MRAPVLEASYLDLPDRFFTRLEPSPVRAPKLVFANPVLGDRLGLDRDWLTGDEALEVFSGNLPLAGGAFAALAYAGHQFGHFVPSLGDGRALLVGEVVAPDGARFDIHLKGSGRTPYSRGGDGRAGLGPVLREVILSEAMAALGLPTTRALAAVLTGEGVVRERIEPGAVLVRIAASHIRIGTFEYFAARKDVPALEALLHYAASRHDPDCLTHENRALAFLEGVMERQANLVARWMGLGFVHGVMNTDNMTISGETIDYGPCAFLDAYVPDKVYSSIDREGRYSFANQPRIAHWNLARLAESLVPLIDPASEAEGFERARDLIDSFAPRFQRHWLAVMGAKIGLGDTKPDDRALVLDLLSLMADHGIDHTNGFRALTREGALAQAAPHDALSALASNPAYALWRQRWLARLDDDRMEATRRMQAANPVRIPRNSRVEEALKAANEGDLAPFAALMEALKAPYDEDPALTAYERPPARGEEVTRTFCGT